MPVSTKAFMTVVSGTILAVAVLINALQPLTLPAVCAGRSWDGGEWGGVQELTGYSRGIPYEPRALVFDGKMFLFYDVVSKTTGDDDEMAEPSDYSLFDVAYRTYDGKKWSGESLMTSPFDEVSDHLEAVATCDGALFAITDEAWMSEPRLLEWNYSLAMYRFNGIGWDRSPSPLAADDVWQRYSTLDVFAFNGSIWALGDFGGHGMKEFDGRSWSPLKPFSFPTGNAIDEMFIAWDGGLWAVWTTQVYSPGKGNSPQGVYLGRYDGADWTLVEDLTPANGTGEVHGPIAMDHDGELVVCWQQAHSDGDTVGSDILLRTYHDGTKGEVVLASAGVSGSNYHPQLCVYKDRLYVLWKNSVGTGDALTFHDHIRSYDGVRLSSVYRIPALKDTTLEFQEMVVYDGRLWLSWKGFCYDGDCSEVLFMNYLLR